MLSCSRAGYLVSCRILGQAHNQPHCLLMALLWEPEIPCLSLVEVAASERSIRELPARPLPLGLRATEPGDVLAIAIQTASSTATVAVSVNQHEE